jgi:hypothetical protein
MTITTEEEEFTRLARLWNEGVSSETFVSAIRSLAAERDTLKAAINEALTEELPIEGGTWSQEPIGPNETAGEAIRRLIKHRVQIGRQAERDALRAENENLRAALQTARRDALEKAALTAENEPEPEGDPPPELHGRSVKNIAIASVRATKRSIAAAIRALKGEGHD